VGAVKRIFYVRVRISRSRSFKVINFGANRKRVCDFLLVRHSNFGPILHRLDMLQDFFAPQPYFTLLLGGVPVGTDRRCWGQPEQLAYAN